MSTISLIGLDDECIRVGATFKSLGYQVTVYGPARSQISQFDLYPAKDMVSAIEASELIVTCYRDATLISLGLRSQIIHGDPACFIPLLFVGHQVAESDPAMLSRGDSQTEFATMDGMIHARRFPRLS